LSSLCAGDRAVRAAAIFPKKSLHGHEEVYITGEFPGIGRAASERFVVSELETPSPEKTRMKWRMMSSKHELADARKGVRIARIHFSLRGARSFAELRIASSRSLRFHELFTSMPFASGGPTLCY
jgi:hypothetical protein